MGLIQKMRKAAEQARRSLGKAAEPPQGQPAGLPAGRPKPQPGLASESVKDRERVGNHRPVANPPSLPAPPLTDQLRQAIRDSGQSIYAISQGSRRKDGMLRAFMAGKSSLRGGAIEKLLDYLGLEVVLRPKPPEFYSGFSDPHDPSGWTAWEPGRDSA